MSDFLGKLFHLPDFVPELQEIMGDLPPDPHRLLSVSIRMREPESEGGTYVPEIGDRHQVPFSDGESIWHWKVESIRSLFRGDRQPPVIGDHPEVYNDAFLLFDWHILEVSRAIGDRRDGELREIFSTLRRRPDGRSLGFVHDYFWQAAALILGTRILSQAEFEAIMARLERSCRTFERGPTSHNFVTAVQSTLGQK
ncbi:MAG: hypothetical protein ACKV19_15455 [Verrucomicrobiales bacterium]